VSEWFEHWFGEEYLELYPHRDDEEAERVAALLESRGVVRRGDRVVDLACGAGRHAVALSRIGARVVGLDLSLPLLRAGQRRWQDARLVRADIRVLPLRTGGADAVVNLFTSFGYFEQDAEHERVIVDVARVLRTGGRFALDFLNAQQVRATLVPRDERPVNGRSVIQERRLEKDGRYVIKTIHLAGEGRSFMERVRLYERADFERMFDAAGLAIDAVLGDYDGSPFAARSPRLLMLARKP
jgi:SAM-dependent methyltransferase